MLPSPTDVVLTVQVGDYVDIKVNPTQHKGMPFKYYHGRTGIVFNVTKRAIGVRVNKLNNGKILEKRIHVRVEHIRPSKCNKQWKDRVEANKEYAAKVKAGQAEKKSLKRTPLLPKGAFTLDMKGVESETIQALPFVDLL